MRVERRVLGGVDEVGDEDRHRIVCRRRDELTLIPPDPDRYRQQQDDRGNGVRQADRPLDRNQLALRVEPVERRDEVCGRRVALLAIRLEAPGDHLLDRLRDARVDRLRQRRRRFDARLQLLDRARRVRMALAEQHVEEYQAQGVDVGALVDGLTLGLLRRHVLHGAEDRSDHR